jgi:hypothetical protein
MNRQRTNPFYPFVILAGTMFVLAASANAVVMVHLLRLPVDEGSTRDSSLIHLVDTYGNHMLIGSLAILAVATIGAIAFDSLRSRRPESFVQDEQGSNSTASKGHES